MTTLHWNYKDLFRACRLGFSAKKIWMQFVGFLVGGVGYMLLTYVAYAASGVPLIAAWERFSLIPFLDPYLVSSVAPLIHIHWWSWAIWAVGIAFFVVAGLVTAIAVAKVTYEQLRGDDFFETKEAFRFALGKLNIVLAAPLMPILFAAVITLLGLILSLVGAIPVVGELLVGLLAVPALGASLFVIYLLVIFLFSLVLIPAVIAATKNDAFDTLFEVFSCVNEQSWRLVIYSAVLAILTVLSTVILGWFSLQAVKLGAAILHVFMGGKMTNILSGGDYYFRISLPSWCPLYQRLGGFGATLVGGDLIADGAGQNIAALLIGLAAYVAFLFVVAYGGSVWSSGVTLIFTILTRKKDDKDLLQEKESDELLVPEVPPGSHDTPPSQAGREEPSSAAPGRHDTPQGTVAKE